ncbi:hypothetical protein Pmi06nite_13340 [Planotetraspora mira]|uniref:Uncharacterized protein n=1 Tax=Planotetraspora mira TaxID=58121 RepID=A0A8J3X4P0_9ACTN|nr:hypothetical protein Pmi06nite_13340 [Planotetraspora mira]
MTGAAAEDPPDVGSLSLPQAAVTPRARAVAAAAASILPRRDLSIIPDPSQVVSRISWGGRIPWPVPDIRIWERSHEESSMSNANVNMPKPNCYSGPGWIGRKAHMRAQCGMGALPALYGQKP